MKEKMQALLLPKSIAVIGASRNKDSVGYGILKSLVKGCVLKSRTCKPFNGKVFAINSHARKVQGKKCFASVLDVKGEVDLAIISIPSKSVIMAVRECIAKKVKAIVIVSAGFAETGTEGRLLQEEIARECENANIVLLGPNCLGFLIPPINLNASFALSIPQAGSVALVTQSGALADSIIDWAIEERYKFSGIVSLGNSAGLDASDFIEWFGEDEETKVITTYLEGVRDGRKFMRIAKEVSAKKPILLVKGGRTEEGTKAIGSHTGSITGSYEVYSTACKQSGVVLCDSVEEMFDLAKTLSAQKRSRNNAVAIITNGGGAGVLCADYCKEYGINLVQLRESTLKKLDATGKMHPAYSRRNPLDIIGDALPERYEAAITTLLGEDYIHELIIVQTLQTMTDAEEDAKIIAKASKKWRNKAIVCVFMGGRFSKKGIEALEKNNIPDFNDPKKAARAMAALVGVL